MERGRGALDKGERRGRRGVLTAALGLFVGAPLADLAGLPVAAGRPSSRSGVEAVELPERGGAAAGRHEPLLGELETAVREHPYRERLREQQIVALYRAGRQKDALDAYRRSARCSSTSSASSRARRLRELEQAVLRQDPALAAPAAGGRRGAAAGARRRR